MRGTGNQENFYFFLRTHTAMIYINAYNVISPVFEVWDRVCNAYNVCGAAGGLRCFVCAVSWEYRLKRVAAPWPD
jgi:hypothetical protein